jgi:hypothetical protein
MKPSLRSVAYRQVLSAKRATLILANQGFPLYNVGRIHRKHLSCPYSGKYLLALPSNRPCYQESVFTEMRLPIHSLAVIMLGDIHVKGLSESFNTSYSVIGVSKANAVINATSPSHFKTDNF